MKFRNLGEIVLDVLMQVQKVGAQKILQKRFNWLEEKLQPNIPSFEKDISDKILSNDINPNYGQNICILKDVLISYSETTHSLSYVRLKECSTPKTDYLEFKLDTLYLEHDENFRLFCIQKHNQLVIFSTYKYEKLKTLSLSIFRGDKIDSPQDIIKTFKALKLSYNPTNIIQSEDGDNTIFSFILNKQTMDNFLINSQGTTIKYRVKEKENRVPLNAEPAAKNFELHASIDSDIPHKTPTLKEKFTLKLEDFIHKPILSPMQSQARYIFIAKKNYRLKDILNIKGHVKSITLIDNKKTGLFKLTDRIQSVKYLENVHGKEEIQVKSLVVLEDIIAYRKVKILLGLTDKDSLSQLNLWINGQLVKTFELGEANCSGFQLVGKKQKMSHLVMTICASSGVIRPRIFKVDPVKLSLKSLIVNMKGQNFDLNSIWFYKSFELSGWVGIVVRSSSNNDVYQGELNLTDDWWSKKLEIQSIVMKKVFTGKLSTLSIDFNE